MECYSKGFSDNFVTGQGSKNTYIQSCLSLHVCLVLCPQILIGEETSAYFLAYKVVQNHYLLKTIFSLRDVDVQKYLA